jgi:hypothetical protein
VSIEIGIFFALLGAMAYSSDREDPVDLTAFLVSVLTLGRSFPSEAFAGFSSRRDHDASSSS